MFGIHYFNVRLTTTNARNKNYNTFITSKLHKVRVISRLMLTIIDNLFCFFFFCIFSFVFVPLVFTIFCNFFGRLEFRLIVDESFNKSYFSTRYNKYILTYHTL